VHKKSSKWLSLVLCFVFICGSMLYIPKKNEVKAFLPVVAGEALVYAIAVSMGIYATSQNASAIATDLYTNLPSDLKALADSKSATVTNTGLSSVDLTRSQYEQFVQQIISKFGVNPPAQYIDTPYGNMFSVAGGVFNDVSTTPLLYMLGSQVKSCSTGKFLYEVHTESPGSQWCIVTCPDGYKFRVNLPGMCGTNYTTNWKFFGPVMFNNTTSKTIHFLAYSEAGTYAGYQGGIGDIYTGNGVDSFPNYSGNHAETIMAEHLGNAQTMTIPIDTNAYNSVVNSTATNDVSLKVSTDMDKIVDLTAESIVATNNVGDNVLDIGADIVNGLNALGEFVVNGINAVTNTISSTVASIGEGVQSIVDSMVGAPTVAVNFAPLTIAGSTIATKFPFSIPFDLVNSVSALNVSGVAPHWQYTFPAGIYNGTGSIDIDFAQFEDWAKVVRWGMLISFSVGLILITRQIIGGE
jgi:hypothetical protein